MESNPPALIVANVCGGNLCPMGGEHDMSKQVAFRDSTGRITGGSVVCSKCGVSAMDLDLIRLP